MTGLMDRRLVVRLRSLAVVRKRAGRGSFAPGGPGSFAPGAPGSAKEPSMRGPGRALSSNVWAICWVWEWCRLGRGAEF
jgi:transposase